MLAPMACSKTLERSTQGSRQCSRHNGNVVNNQPRKQNTVRRWLLVRSWCSYQWLVRATFVYDCHVLLLLSMVASIVIVLRAVCSVR